MLRIEKILCPVDFSECSAKAYEYAYSLARHYGARLFVQHVAEQLILAEGFMPHPQIHEFRAHQSAEAQDRFRELARDIKNGVEQEFVFQHSGFAADFILSFAEGQQVDLIVMGTHGRRGLDRLVLGSVLERVLRKTRSPVLAVRTAHPDVPNSEHEVGLRRILFCTDFSEDSPRALEYALSIAMQYSADLSLLHVLENLGTTVDLKRQEQNAMESLQHDLPEEASQWASITPIVRAGNAYQEIIRYAEEMKSDVIVMGVRGRKPIDLALFGSTTHRVIQLGPCPVLVVRT
jgi:nucleotide-binding universal stress UspA family protein